MNFRKTLFSLAFACSLGATAMTWAHEGADSVKPNFAAPITNIPGKSLIAVEVLYPPGGVFAAHARQVLLHLRLCGVGAHREQGQ